MTPRSIAKLLGPLRRGINLMIGRAVVTLVNDALKCQGVQISLLADEVRDAERVQDYGFTSHPHPGAQAVAAAVGGNRNHLVVICCDDRRYRISLEEGEVAMYDDLGSKVVLKRGNIIEVTAATKVRMVTPLLEVTGDIKADGKVEAGGDMRDTIATNARTLKGVRDQYNVHTHNDPQGGVTGVPNQGM